MAPPKPKSDEVSAHMRGIRTKRTGLECRVRSVLRRMQLRFRGNVTALPGTPDIVLEELQLAIFINGCFWHGCSRCFRPPKHNRKWWLNKIEVNRRRDRRVARQLRRLGFSVIQIWEHDSDSRIETRLRTASRSATKCAITGRAMKR